MIIYMIEELIYEKDEKNSKKEGKRIILMKNLRGDFL